MALAPSDHDTKGIAAPGSDIEYGHDEQDDAVLATILDDIEVQSRQTSFRPGSVVETIEEHAPPFLARISRASNSQACLDEEVYDLGLSPPRGLSAQIELESAEHVSFAGTSTASIEAFAVFPAD